MNILYFPHLKRCAQFYLRHLWPGRELSRHGHRVILKNPDALEFWKSAEQMYEEFKWADVIVAFQPRTRQGLKAMEIARQLHKPFVIDSDDFVFAVDPSNQTYGTQALSDVYVNDKPLWINGVNYLSTVSELNVVRMQEAIDRADGFSVTTKVLSDLYAPFVSDPEKLWVLPNSLDLSVYKIWDLPKKELRIGWQGGQSHYRDILMVKDALIKIVEKYPNVKLVFLGSTWPKLFKDIPQDKVEYHPWVDSETYPLKIGSLNLDIGLCPIVDNIFNKGKSNLKQVEYGVFGVPSVVSTISYGPYNDTRDGVDGMVVDCSKEKTQEEITEGWVEKISVLVEDHRKREEIGGAYRDVVNECYNIANNWEYWEECYETVRQPRILAKVQG